MQVSEMQRKIQQKSFVLKVIVSKLVVILSLLRRKYLSSAVSV